MHTPVEKDGNSTTAKRAARRAAVSTHDKTVTPGRPDRQPHPANVTRGNTAMPGKPARTPHPANVTRGKAAVSTRADAKAPHPANVTRGNTKGNGARQSKPPHLANVTASGKPKTIGNGSAKSAYSANGETPLRASRSPTDRRASSAETRRAKPSEIEYGDYVESILRLEAGGDERALAQRLSLMSSTELCAIAERFAGSTTWRTSGQVKWLRGETVVADARRVIQVLMQRAAGALTTKFEIVEVPVDARLAPDWQATRRFGKGRVLEFNVRTPV